ncbi:MAG: hypothetical protein ACOYKE_04685 [Ferruginibacter sp.]
MKKILFSFLAATLFTAAFAQNEYKKQPSLAVSFLLNDFKSAADIRSNGLSSVLRTKDWKNMKRMDAGIAITYTEGLSNNVDFAGTIAGSFVNYPIKDKAPSVGNKLLLDATAVANLKLFSDKYWVSPYLTLGVGVSQWDGYFGAFIPAGVGLQLNLWDEVFVLVNSQYRMPVTENASYHLYHSIGIAGNLFKHKKK